MSDVEEKIQEEIKAKKSNIQMGFSGLQKETVFPSDSPNQKINMVRQSGHLTEQIIGKGKSGLKKMSEKLTALIQGGNEKNQYMIEDMQLRLKVQEHRMLATIRKFLNELSEKDLSSEKYLMGNFFPNGQMEMISYGGTNKHMPSPILRIKKSDFYREYTGKDKYSGKDKINADKCLDTLCDKKFKIIYPQTVFINNQEKVEIILDYHPLIKRKEVINVLSSSDAKSIDNWIPQSPTESEDNYIYISLNPLWIDQIKSKYVEYPEDLNSRLLKALDNNWQNLNTYTQVLVDTILHWRSNKKDSFEYDEETLYKKLGLNKLIKRREKSKAEKYLFDAIETLKKIKLIKEATKIKGANNQDKWIFEIYLEIPEM